jgi:cobalt/nickel transport system permease protein
MQSIQAAVLDLKKLELLANGASTIHRIDARAKVLVTLTFILSVASYGRYEISPLLPFFIFPVVLISLSGLPPFFILKKILLICPIVLAVGIFNPLFDREILIQLGPFGISGGWLSCASILVRSILTVGAGFVLVGVTGFTAVCRALERLGMPQAVAVQMLFIYRYIFILAEEAERSARARALRSCGRKGQGMRSFGSLIGHLMLRTWQRAERVHSAMQSRGFTGEFHSRRQGSIGAAELYFTGGWSVFFVTLRVIDIPGIFGGFITGLFS